MPWLFWRTTKPEIKPIAPIAIPVEQKTEPVKPAVEQINLSEVEKEVEKNLSIDRLANAQEKLTCLRNDFEKELRTWENIKQHMFRNGVTVSSSDFKKSVDSKLEVKKNIAQKITTALKELLQSPELYIREHLLPVIEQIDLLKMRLNEITKMTANDQSIEEKQKCELEICEANIVILRLFTKMIDETQDEIKYCLTVEKIGERLLKGAIGFAAAQVQLTYGLVVTLDISMENKYRERLYNQIREEVDRLCGFMSSTSAIIDQGKSICFFRQPSSANLFHNPDRDTRAAPDKLLPPEDRHMARTASCRKF